MCDGSVQPLDARPPEIECVYILPVRFLFDLRARGCNFVARADQRPRPEPGAEMTNRMHVLLHAVPLMIVAAPPAIAASAMSAEEALVAPAKTGALQKLGPWLANLHDEFQQAPDKKAFHTRNPVLKVHNGMVGVDLYANDAASLQASLASLGATRV